jgi:recombination protein RecT
MRTGEVVKYQENAIVSDKGTLKELITQDKFKQALKEISPAHLDATKLARLALMAASRNPRLLQCTQGSLLVAVLEASTLGLDISGLSGEGYLVPYRNGFLSKKAGREVYEANFQPGYLGLVKLARQSGLIVDIRAGSVYDGDEFAYGEGLTPFLIHNPNKAVDPRKCPDPKDILYAYAIADWADGRKTFKVMTIGEIETHRKRSRAAADGPWMTDYEAMCLKTVIRLLCKFLPRSYELTTALANDTCIELDAHSGMTDARAVEDDSSKQKAIATAALLSGQPHQPVPEQTSTEDDIPVAPRKRGRPKKAQTNASPETQPKAVSNPAESAPPVETEEIEAKVRDLYEHQDKFWLETTNNQTMTIDPELWDTIGQFKLKDVILKVRHLGNKQHVVGIYEFPQGV